jgi:hypothetical protein
MGFQTRTKGGVTLKALQLISGLALAIPATLIVAIHLLTGQAGSMPTPIPHAKVTHFTVPQSMVSGVSGFPDPSNTGVPAGTKLLTVPGQISSGPGWHYDSRGFVEVNGNGAVLSGLYIPYNVNIAANNVTIKDVQVVTGGANVYAISLRHTANVTIEDCTISGINATSGRTAAGIKDIYADSTGVSILRNNISLGENGVQLESGTVSGNYIHDPGYLAGDHTNGVTSNGGGTALLTISHNTILINRGQTDAIGLFEDFGVQTNRVINGNLLAGGDYSIYAGQKTGGPPATDIVITNNVISSIYYPLGGYYGSVAHFNLSGHGNIWSGNIWNVNNRLIARPGNSPPRTVRS